MTGYELWRLAFGAYLAFFFLRMFPFAGEIYGPFGMMPDPNQNWTHGYFFGILDIANSSLLAITLLFIGVVLAIFIASGRFVRSSSILLILIYASLYHRNNLTEDPSYGFVGWLILVCAVQGSEKNLHPKVLLSFWVTMAATYFYSGLTKILSPSWTEGLAIQRIMSSPIVYPWAEGWIGGASSTFLSWMGVGAQILAPLLIAIKKTRWMAWAMLLGEHVFILVTLAIPQVSLGMILFHFLVFQKSWIEKLRFARPAEARAHAN